MSMRIIVSLAMMTGYIFGVSLVYDVELSSNDNFSSNHASQTFIATVDSISEVSFFCGRKIIPGYYIFQLRDSAGIILLGEALSDSTGFFDYEPVSAIFDPRVYVKKGFTYRLVIKHNQDSLINFYYNHHDSYPDGELIGYEGYDLSARIRGVNASFQSLFGINSCLTVTSNEAPRYFRYPERWKECIASMKATGIKWDRQGHCAWQHFQFESYDVDSFHHGWCDSLMYYYALDSINVFWLFTQSTRWTTCTVSDLYIPHDTFYGEWYDGLPKNLFEPVIDKQGHINSDNYFAQYVYKFVLRYGPGGEFWRVHQDIPYNPVRYYDMWNEPEWALGWDSSGIQVHHYWCADSVTDVFYDSLIDADGSEFHKQSLIHVYSRLCIVGDSAVKIAAARNNAKDSVFTVVYVPYYGSTGYVTPQEWLVGLRDNGVANFCDGMSFHSYADPQSIPLFHNRQKLNLDNIWTMLKTFGFGDKFLWCGEYSTGCYIAGADSNTISFPVQTAAQLATITSLAANDPPMGPLTHGFLWAFSHLYFPDIEWEGRLFCLSRDDFTYRPPGFGYRQLASILGNCRFNQGLISRGIHDTARVYEFEDPQTEKKIYIGWKERGIGGGPVPFMIPLRTNAGRVENIAYNNSSYIRTQSADANGFLKIHLDTVPVYVYEPVDSVLRRPDLVIDSIWTEPSAPGTVESITIKALIRNADQVTSSPQNVTVDFYLDDVLIGRNRLRGSVNAQGIKVSTSRAVPLAHEGSFMCRVVVNQEKEFVELDSGNNTGYVLITIPQ